MLRLCLLVVLFILPRLYRDGLFVQALPSEPQSLRVLMILTYRRTQSTLRILRDVLNQHPAPASLHIVVSQSCDEATSPYVVELAEGLETLRDRFASITHTKSPHLRQDSSFSNDRKLYGSKRNSVHNMLRGLEASFSVATGLASSTPSSSSSSSSFSEDASSAAAVMVVEDDVHFASDTLAYFEHAARVMRGERGGGIDGIHFATAGATAYRPSILFGSRDIEAHLRRPSASSSSSSPSDDRDDVMLNNDEVVEGSRLQHLGGEDAVGDGLKKRGTRDVLVGTQKQERIVDILEGTPRTVFKTYAWSLSLRGFQLLRPMLAESIEYEQPFPLRNYYAKASRVTSGGSRGREGDASSAVHKTATQSVAFPAPATFRSGHPSLKGCLFCNDYCYDHSIEWLLQGRRYLSPRIPRIAQEHGSAGMTQTKNEVFERHLGEPVASNDFIDLPLPFFSPLRWLLLPGWTTIAPPPPYLPAVSDVDDGSGNAVNDNTAADALRADYVYRELEKRGGNEQQLIGSSLETGLYLILYEPILLIAATLILCCGGGVFYILFCTSLILTPGKRGAAGAQDEYSKFSYARSPRPPPPSSVGSRGSFLFFLQNPYFSQQPKKEKV